MFVMNYFYFHCLRRPRHVNYGILSPEFPNLSHNRCPLKHWRRCFNAARNLCLANSKQDEQGTFCFLGGETMERSQQWPRGWQPSGSPLRIRSPWTPGSPWWSTGTRGSPAPAAPWSPSGRSDPPYPGSGWSVGLCPCIAGTCSPPCLTPRAWSCAGSRRQRAFGNTACGAARTRWARPSTRTRRTGRRTRRSRCRSLAAAPSTL